MACHIEVVTHQARWCGRCESAWASPRSSYRCDICNGVTTSLRPQVLTRIVLWNPEHKRFDRHVK